MASAYSELFQQGETWTCVCGQSNGVRALNCLSCERNKDGSGGRGGGGGISFSDGGGGDRFLRGADDDIDEDEYSDADDSESTGSGDEEKGVDPQATLDEISSRRETLNRRQQALLDEVNGQSKTTALTKGSLGTFLEQMNAADAGINDVSAHAGAQNYQFDDDSESKNQIYPSPPHQMDQFKLPRPMPRTCQCGKPVFADRKKGTRSRVCGTCYKDNKTLPRKSRSSRNCRDCGKEAFSKSRTRQCGACYDADQSDQCEACGNNKPFADKYRTSHVCTACFDAANNRSGRHSQQHVHRRPPAVAPGPGPGAGPLPYHPPGPMPVANYIVQPQQQQIVGPALHQPVYQAVCIDCNANPRFYGGSSLVCSQCYDRNKRGRKKWCMKCGKKPFVIDRKSNKVSKTCSRCYDFVEVSIPSGPKPKKPLCRYNGFCYIQNKTHSAKYHHPPLCKYGKNCFNSKYKHYGDYRHPHMKKFLKICKKYKLTSFRSVQKFVTRRQTSAPSDVRITHIRVINTVKHRASYKSPKKKGKKKNGQRRERMLFHGTKKDCAICIRNGGFIVDAKGNGGMLGKGIYFAPDPQKCTQYTDEKNAMFLCLVNIENAQEKQNKMFYEYKVDKESDVMCCFLLYYKHAK